MSTRAVIVDDSTAVRLGLPLMAPDIDFVAAYATAEELLLHRPEVDVVALDLKLRGGAAQGVLQGPAAIRQVADAGYRVCIYTDERRRFVLAACLRAGALGIAHKSDSGPATQAALIAVSKGLNTVTQSLVGLAELLERRGGLPTLTERQRAVLRARSRGERWADIAHRLHITEGVAREHMAAVNAKFARYLVDATAADLEHHLGIGPGDLLDEE